jgi:hypothetical protein
VANDQCFTDSHFGGVKGKNTKNSRSPNPRLDLSRWIQERSGPLIVQGEISTFRGSRIEVTSLSTSQNVKSRNHHDRQSEERPGPLIQCHRISAIGRTEARRLQSREAQNVDLIAVVDQGNI